MSDSDIEAGLAAAADSLHLDCESFRGEIVDLEKRIEELEADNKRLREALQEILNMQTGEYNDVAAEMQEVARNALEEE